jgi:hypothetical protein
VSAGWGDVLEAGGEVGVGVQVGGMLVDVGVGVLVQFGRGVQVGGRVFAGFSGIGSTAVEQAVQLNKINKNSNLLGIFIRFLLLQDHFLTGSN